MEGTSRASVPKNRTAARLAAVVLVVLGVCAGWQSSASALTPTEKYITAVHRDFLLRDPTANELIWWNAYLGSNSRQAFVDHVLGSDEFKEEWIGGIRLYYLTIIDDEDASYTADLNALKSSGNFLASETTLLGSQTYWEFNGETNTSFAESLFQRILLRPSDPSGLSYWVNRLNNGTSTRSQVASSMIRSTEAARRRVAGDPSATFCPTTVIEDENSLSAGAFCIILDRLADPSGSNYWTTQLSNTSQLPEMWSALASSNEYYNHAQL